MASIWLDTNSNFQEWCGENGYDGDEEIDYEESVYKRGAHIQFYIKKESDDTYAMVTANQDYDWGRDNITIESEGLKRVEKQVTTTVISYE